MRVVVTGAGGFVGAALVRALAFEGARVTALDSQSFTAPSAVRKIVGDILDPYAVGAALADGADIVIHLAALPGGAAAADPALSRRINVDATLNLFDAVGAANPSVRLVYASTVAVLGPSLPERVDDSTPRRPGMAYGAHKLMAEIALAELTRQRALDGIAVRLPGIVARPGGNTALKSAFMSDVFHAVAGGRPFVSPVSHGATMWLMSLRCCVRNLLHASNVDPSHLPEARALTLPVVRASMAELVAAIARHCGTDPSLVSYAPDAQLEHAFGNYPTLETGLADAAGFASDGGLDDLVSAVLDGSGDVARSRPGPQDQEELR